MGADRALAPVARAKADLAPVVISAAGTTLMWVMAMTLWLPSINYGKTYRDVAQAAQLALPSTYTCVQPIRMGDAQLASFAYFGHIRFGGPMTAATYCCGTMPWTTAPRAASPISNGA
jgi:4-amino-4-deoxy-L-arabinose transferase-like glycosyltransferase